MVASMVQDVKQSARALAKNPGFTLAAVIVLALGIGANTAIFSVVNAALLRPLPFHDSDRVVQLWHVPPAKMFPGMSRFALSAANYFDWKQQSRAFSRMAIYSYSGFSLTGAGNPENVRSAAVEPDFFSVLEAQPILGRTIATGEDQPGHDRVIVLSYEFWQSHFGGDRGVIGRHINLDGQECTVIGVMGANFRLPGWAQAWTPQTFTPETRSVRGEHHYLAIARLRPGATVAQAQAELDTISSRLAQQYPADDKDWGAKVVPLREQMVGEVRPILLVLLGAVTFVLLIACANVANLVLAKTLARRKEMAIRAALGASRARLLQQVVSETVLLSIAGGALGLTLAKFGVDLIVHFLAGQLPRAVEVRLDAAVLLFTMVISLLAGVVAGLVPAWRLTKADVSDALKQGGRTDAEGGRKGTRTALVVSEVALSLMLLAGAGLTIRSLWILHRVNPGFDPQNAVKMALSINANKYSSPALGVQFVDHVLQRVGALPGVESVAGVDDLPTEGGSHQPIAIEGRPVVSLAEQPEVDVRVITPAYLRTMRIPLIGGRDISEADVAHRPAVVLISQSMAQRFWPNENPVGRHVTMSFTPELGAREIVGIVGDVKQNGLDYTEPTPTLYYPVAQVSVGNTGGWRGFSFTLVVRTSTPPTSVVSAVVNAVHEVDREVPVTGIETLEDFLAESVSQQRFTMLLLAAFAGVALLLAAIGIYSVLAYTVRRRLREIGIRMALGAQVSDVMRMVIADGMRPTLIGVALGALGTLALGRVLRTIVFGISPSDPLTFASVVVLLVAVSLVASAVPAHRATQVDPLKTLREE